MLCVEECKVDVGVENVVVVGRKAEESRVTWERFEVGSTSTPTTVSGVCGGWERFEVGSTSTQTSEWCVWWVSSNKD